MQCKIEYQLILVVCCHDVLYMRVCNEGTISMFYVTLSKLGKINFKKSLIYIIFSWLLSDLSQPSNFFVYLCN